MGTGKRDKNRKSSKFIWNAMGAPFEEFKHFVSAGGRMKEETAEMRQGRVCLDTMT